LRPSLRRGCLKSNAHLSTRNTLPNSRRRVASLASESGFYEATASDGLILRVMLDKTNSAILEAVYVMRKLSRVPP